jgi:hypothetical protein
MGTSDRDDSGEHIYEVAEKIPQYHFGGTVMSVPGNQCRHDKNQCAHNLMSATHKYQTTTFIINGSA